MYLFPCLYRKLQTCFSSYIPQLSGLSRTESEYVLLVGRVLLREEVVVALHLPIEPLRTNIWLKSAIQIQHLPAHWPMFSLFAIDAGAFIVTVCTILI